MLEIAQELMTPHETARWFRRSPSWLRQQHDLLHTGGPGGQPLFHVRVCRAYVLGKLCGLAGEELKKVQLQALTAACGIGDTRNQADVLESAESTPAAIVKGAGMPALVDATD